MFANRRSLCPCGAILFWLPGTIHPPKFVIWWSALFAVLLFVTTTVSAPAESHAAEILVATESNKNVEAVPLVRGGIEAYNAGDYSTAVKDLKQAQGLVPAHSPTALYLGLAYLKQGSLTEAIAAWEKYITLKATTTIEKTNNLQDTVSRDLTILVREQNRQQAEVKSFMNGISDHRIPTPLLLPTTAISVRKNCHRCKSQPADRLHQLPSGIQPQAANATAFCHCVEQCPVQRRERLWARQRSRHDLPVLHWCG